MSAVKMKFVIVREMSDDAVDLSGLEDLGFELPDSPEEYNPEELLEYVSDLEGDVSDLVGYIEEIMEQNADVSRDPVVLFFGLPQEFDTYANIIAQKVWKHFEPYIEIDPTQDLFDDEYVGEERAASETSEEDEDVTDYEETLEETSEESSMGSEGGASEDHEEIQNSRDAEAARNASESDIPIPRPDDNYQPQFGASRLEALRKEAAQSKRPVSIPASISSNFRDPLKFRTFRPNPPQPLPDMDMKTVSLRGIPVTVFRNITPS
jgi:hypothetical protein